jgi:hypothetical protein
MALSIGEIYLTERWFELPPMDVRVPARKGEIYRCRDEKCGCEIQVTKEGSGDLAPRCCCGRDMIKA